MAIHVIYLFGDYLLKNVFPSQTSQHPYLNENHKHFFLQYELLCTCVVCIGEFFRETSCFSYLILKFWVTCHVGEVVCHPAVHASESAEPPSRRQVRVIAISQMPSAKHAKIFEIKTTL